MPKEPRKLSTYEGMSAEWIIENLGIEFDVNDWGSCQYTGALNTFGALTKLSKKFGEKTALRLLNIQFSHGKRRAPRKVSSLHWEKSFGNLKESIEVDQIDLDYYLALQKNYKLKKNHWAPEKKELPKFIKRVRKSIVEHKKGLKGPLMTGDKLFKWCRNQSWDLWGAAPYVANLFFPDFKVTGVDTAPGQGPKWNILVQSDNYKVGATCWYLKKKGIVKSEKSFASFDT